MSDPRERLAQQRAEKAAKDFQDIQDAKAAAVALMGDRLGLPLGELPVRPPAPRVGSQQAPVVPRVHVPSPPREAIEEAEAMEAQQAAEDEERARLMAEQVAAQVEAQQAKKASKKTLPRKPVHPLLTQLREEFGVSEAKAPVEVTVADHKWKFVPLSGDMIAVAARIADRLSVTENEHGLRIKHAAVCCAIVGVDDVPVWQMLGIEPTESDDTKGLVPRGSIRTKAAFGLFAELTDNLKNRLLEALYEAYVDKVDREGDVLGYASYEKTEMVQWACPADGCTHRLTRARRQAENGDMLPYHCELHGDAMVEYNVIKPRIDEDLSPLR